MNIVQRPWGSFEILYETETYKVKRIVVNPNQSFSLQYHNNRWEDWIIVEGSGCIQNGEIITESEVGYKFHIPPKSIHRATAGDAGLVFIEIQRGICDENDIVRLKDDYGRD